MAEIGVGTTNGDVTGYATTDVPVASDGSWSGQETVTGTGTHPISAECLASATAPAPYVQYQPAQVVVPTTSVEYWVAVASRTTVDGFGDASSFSPMPVLPVPPSPVVGVAGNPATGAGYWTATAGGGVYTYGDAGFYGAASGLALQAGIVGIAPTPSGRGYWLAARDGGVFTFGDAAYVGSGVGASDGSPTVGLAPYGAEARPAYLLARADGTVTKPSTPALVDQF